MVALLAHAQAIADRHRAILISAVAAEEQLMELCFCDIRFGKHGIISASYLGVIYPLGAQS